MLNVLPGTGIVSRADVGGPENRKYIAHRLWSLYRMRVATTIIVRYGPTYDPRAEWVYNGWTSTAESFCGPGTWVTNKIRHSYVISRTVWPGCCSQSLIFHIWCTMTKRNQSRPVRQTQRASADESKSQCRVLSMFDSRSRYDPCSTGCARVASDRSSLFLAIVVSRDQHKTSVSSWSAEGNWQMYAQEQLEQM